MAFDQTTRNRLQRFVNSAREILSEEFTRQLQAVYGMDPKQGTVADISSLTHLNNSQRQTAHILRETLEHYLATTPGKSDKDRVKQVLSRIVREQAFTVLNRLAALRMAEARDFLLESVSKGQSSKGFQLYRQLAGTSHGETGDAYRNYLFSLFDEFSIDLAVLFDRYSIQGRLFPRESALLELLAEINHHEIEALWAEDETIGWIYQYFNSQEERKKMRAESQAPRNSRELAVRNQFFTPRYVVEFLTDNTLGRIWYEMTQGNTALIDSCSYLVRRPNEIFLKLGEQSPETDSVEGESLIQDELLKQPVCIPYRKLKDPRSIRMLDPACGSMHFGLYAFDLYEQIYLEAWQLEQELGPDAFQREANQQALQTSFANLDEFKAQIPKLIIEHNIHGVDIDPRAVQIAGLSLWQRAQRAWQQQGVKPQQRPVIVKSNIVCAEPMPGDKDLLKEFTGKLHPPALGQLVEVIFDKMELAGDAGTLLKIEEEIQTAIDNARDQWETKKGSDSIGDLFEDELDAATPQHELGFDLYGIDNETFWDDAEQLILKALSDYADRAESDTDQKRLFAEDAAKGFAFIDLCRKRFDVVLMNPPFGRGSSNIDSYLRFNFPYGYIDLYTAFLDRGSEKTLLANGYLGAITSKTFFMLSSFEKWRKSSVLGKYPLQVCIDLGAGVLDSAMVETAAFVIGHCHDSLIYPAILDLRHSSDKELSFKNKIRQIENFSLKTINYFKMLPNSPIVYDLSEEQSLLFKNTSKLNEIGEIYGGNATSDDFRFIRLFWEIPQSQLYPNGHSLWRYLSKGGEYSIAYADIHLVLNWKDDGDYLGTYMYESRPRNGYLWGPKSWTSEYMGKTGVFWSLKSQKGISFRALPLDCVMSGKSSMVSTGSYQTDLSLLGILNTKFFSGTAKNMSNAFGAFEKGTIGTIPVSLKNSEDIAKLSLQLFECIKNIHSLYETEHFYSSLIHMTYNSAVDPLEKIQIFIEENSRKAKVLLGEINDIYSTDGFLIQEEANKYISELGSDVCYDLIFSELIGFAFGRWELSENNIDALLNKDLGVYQPFAPLPKVEFTSEKGNEKEFIISIDRDDSTIDQKLGLILNRLLGSEGNRYLDLLVEKSDIKNINEYLSNPNKFFNLHLKRYAKSRRQAPIYWPLQTLSGSYTLCVYYHRLNEQTLYICINDFVEPKLAIVTADLNSLRNKSARSTEEEKELAQLSDLETELKDFRDELLRLAKFWKPNLNDGVQITAAPLWKLFQHKAWQKKLKETWGKLEDGEYDWAHLAGSIWPERVLRKCHQDRSLAIAHDVEDIFWHEVEISVMRGKKSTGNTKIEWQPKELTDAEITALIKQTVIGSK